MELVSSLIEGDVTKEIKNFSTSTKIKTKDGLFIEIKNIKLKVIMKTIPADLTPPAKDNILMAPVTIQHLIKLNLLGVIFALKNNPGTFKLFVKIIKQLIAEVSSYNLSKCEMKVPSIGAINNVLKSDLIQQDSSGLLFVQFDKFSKEMFLRLCHVITFTADTQDHFISVTQSLYEEDSYFESSLLLQILILIFEKDITSLDDVISTTSSQSDPNIKQSNRNVSVSESDSGNESGDESGSEVGSEAELMDEVSQDDQPGVISNDLVFIVEKMVFLFRI